jgi:hypothetical protein
VLDLSFDPAKNIVNDALHLALRIDTDKIPGDLLRAYTRIETDARAQLNPSGFATKAQKQEAKEAARLAPRPRRPTAGSAAASTTRSSGTARPTSSMPGRPAWGSSTACSRSSGRPSTAPGADHRRQPGLLQAEARGQGRSVEDFGPVGFYGEASHTSVAWTDGDASSRDFWGNEFLIWLWHTLQNDGDTLTLPDGSEATVMVAKTLTLDCPRGETGRDSLTGEGPTRLPEAFRALKAGKLPRKAGLVVVRHGAQYELTLQAETLAVSGAALPKAEGVSGYEALCARVDGLRHLAETLDLLYDAYGRHRTGPDWAGELGRIRRWLTAA